MQNTKQPNTKQDKKTIHRVHCAVTDTTPTQSHNQIHTDTSCTPQIDVSVVDSGGETPGPIPNPEAKPARADGTAPGRRWESRLPPTQQLHTNTRHTPTQVRGGCFSIYPLHHRLADTTTPHRGHCIAGTHALRNAGSPARRGGTDSLRTTPVTHCGPRDSSLQTPQVTTYFAMQTSRREGWFGLITDNTGNALRTPQVPTHSRMQTWFAVGEDTSASLRTPQLRIADTAGTYTLRNADFPACKTAQPGCGEQR